MRSCWRPVLDFLLALNIVGRTYLRPATGHRKPKEERFQCAPGGAHFQRCVPFEISYVSLRTAAEATRNAYLLNGILVVLILLTRRDYAVSFPETISKFASFTNRAEETGQSLGVQAGGWLSQAGGWGSLSDR